MYLIEFLILSMDTDIYSTVLNIIKSNKEDLSLRTIQARLREKETELNGPIEQQESANAAKARNGGNSRDDGPPACWGCKQLLLKLELGHTKVTYKAYLATKAGKEWSKSWRGRIALEKHKDRIDSEKNDDESDDEGARAEVKAKGSVAKKREKEKNSSLDQSEAANTFPLTRKLKVRNIWLTPLFPHQSLLGSKSSGMRRQPGRSQE